MASEPLRFIASHDDMIQLCGTDEPLAVRLRSNMNEASSRPITFDPYMCAASNPDIVSNKKHDIWTNKKLSRSKRGLDSFDAKKFTVLFINMKKQFSKEADIAEPLRDGFDAYAYLMAYEDDIKALYGKRDLTKLQMAALYFIEVNKPTVELDYYKYIASHDDLVKGAVAGNPGKPWDEWIPEVGKAHYESSGKEEILGGHRQVLDFFNPTKYIATYADVQDGFKNEDGSINEQALAVAYITIGAESGLVRDGFNHLSFLANYPELIESDIYVNGNVKDGINPVKVAKLWLEKVKQGVVDLSRFDAVDFKETAGLAEEACAFKAFVELKVHMYARKVKKQAKLGYRLTHKLCSSAKLSKRKDAPVEEPVAESEPVVHN